MRKLAGGIVLAVGVGGLGWYGSNNNAENVQNAITASARDALTDTIHPLDTTVSGRDIIVSGIANNEAEEARILSVLNDVPGRRLVKNNLRVLETASPFVMSASKNEQGTTLSGAIPSEADRTMLGTQIGTAVEGLELMAGAPDTQWTSVVAKGFDSLDLLQEGTLSVSDRNITIIGIALTANDDAAARSALAQLPQDYKALINIDVLDDGRPTDFEVTYNADEGALVRGKLPEDLESSDIATALNLPSIKGDPAQGNNGSGALAIEKLSALSTWLPELESLQVNKIGDQVSVHAIAAPGVDLDLVKAGIANDLGNGVQFDLAAPTQLPEEGSERVNRATDRTEIFTWGYWLPVLSFTADKENCQSESEAAQKNNRIGFVTGSARLDAQSVRAINVIASVIHTCAAQTELHVEVGGHTDSDGSDDLNLTLSQQRADAVRNALIERGVSESDITAKGFGETQPIADNATAEGRATNRRTAITWLDKAAAEVIFQDTKYDGVVQENTEVGE